MDDYITPQEERKILKITNTTLRRWADRNKIRTIKCPSGHRRYNIKDVQATASHGPSIQEKSKICYCRVSSSKQVDDLERQKDLFRSRYPTYELVTDIGSGINWKRKGLKAILERTMHGDISEIVVAHRDRLCRFAFELLEWIFSSNGVELVVLDNDKDKSSESDLADDILSIIHVYSCRAMDKRRYTNKKNKDISEPKSETSNKTVDGNKEIYI